jgi:hypothetical protein
MRTPVASRGRESTRGTAAVRRRIR